MADHAIKPEIKADPADTKEGLAEVDEFEEDHDLHIPPDPPKGWLARVPPELWQAWSEMYSKAPSEQNVKIGTMRVFETPNQPTPKIELHLDRTVSQTREMPQTYSLKVHAADYNNSVVFSEKDLPGHKSQSFGRNRHNAGKSAGVNKYDRFNQQPVKRINGYSSVIPKETALAARIVNEANVIPVEDKDYYESLKRTLTQAMQPKVNTTIHNGLIKAPAPGQANETFSTFTSGTTKSKKKVVKDKNVRMEQKALYDAIHRCYRQYKYWSLKALRNELKQPEDYIRKSLENIATLIRSGDFAMQYMLNPEYAASLDIKDEEVIAEAAAVESGESDSGGEGDDDDMELEDVKMGE